MAVLLLLLFLAAAYLQYSCVFVDVVVVDIDVASAVVYIAAESGTLCARTEAAFSGRLNTANWVRCASVRVCVRDCVSRPVGRLGPFVCAIVSL